jgi:hypothetical protein
MSETRKHTYHADEFESANRDVIRAAASLAGVSNVSYKSKAENIAAMKANGATRIDLDRHGKVVGVATGEVAVVEEPVAEEPADEVVEEAIEQSASVEGSSVDAVDALDSEEAVSGAPADAYPWRYNVTVDSKGASTLVLIDTRDGHARIIPGTHENYVRILEALIAKKDPARWFDKDAVLVEMVEALGDHLSLRFSADTLDDDSRPEVLFDGAPIHGRMVDVFLRFHLEGRDTDGLVKFLEKCQANPVPGAAQLLFDWQGSERMSITPDGDFIGWKSFHKSNDGETFYPTTTSGGGFVDGREVAARSPQDWRINVGSVVTIDPDIVKPGPECGVGLHVGSYEYSMPFQGNVKCHVQVDPSKVVNVPGSERGKMRVVEYTVLDVISDTSRREEASRYEAPETLPAAERSLEIALDQAEVLPKGLFRRFFGRRNRGGAS